MEDPNLAIFKIRKQGFQVLPGNHSRPDDARIVDIGRVVNPLASIHTMLRAVIHQYEVVARHGSQLSDNLRSFDSPGGESESKLGDVSYMDWNPGNHKNQY